jgi:hypothetical protein
MVENTFNYIIKKILNLDNHIFSLNFDNNDKIPGMLKLYFNMYIHNYKQNNKYYKKKFEFLNDIINNFYFINNQDLLDKFFYYFYLIQKTNNALNRFAFIYKFKKSKIIVNTDLQLNELELNDKNVICIYQNNAKYLFKINDLLKMIYTSLTNSSLLFNEPLVIKNPYNNIPFSKSILYNIYLYLITNCDLTYIKLEYIDLFFKFHKLNFNLNKFLNNYEHILRDYTINNFLNNASDNELKEEIDVMIKTYNEKQNKLQDFIIIDDGFPVKKLIKILKPYLYIKLSSSFSLISIIQSQSYLLLFNKLKEFQLYNPNFGRKRFIFKHKRNRLNNIENENNTNKYSYNDKHIKFYDYKNENFLINHLSFINLEYNDYNYYNITQNNNLNNNQNNNNENNIENYNQNNYTNDNNEYNYENNIENYNNYDASNNVINNLSFGNNYNQEIYYDENDEINTEIDYENDDEIVYRDFE